MEHPIPNGSSLLDLVWRDYPYLPRAVAALVAVLDAEETVAAAIGRGEPELAATILADNYRVRDAITAVYGVPWREAVRVFERAMAFGVHHEGRVPGEEVLHAPATRLLYRMGYVDGLTLHVDAPEQPAGRSRDDVTPDDPEPGTADALATAGVSRRVQAVFGMVYDRGQAYGVAEALLRRDHPTVITRLDTVAHAACAPRQRTDATGSRAAADALVELTTHLTTTACEAAAEAAPSEERVRRLAVLYAMARVRAIREEQARHEVVTAVTEGPMTPVAPLGVGAALRVFGQRLDAARRASDHPDASARTQAVVKLADDQMAEVYLLAAMLGLTPEAVAACIDGPERPNYRSVADVLSAHPRDLEAAGQSRALLRALALQGGHGPGRAAAAAYHGPGASAWWPLSQEGLALLPAAAGAELTVDPLREPVSIETERPVLTLAARLAAMPPRGCAALEAATLRDLEAMTMLGSPPLGVPVWTGPAAAEAVARRIADLNNGGFIVHPAPTADWYARLEGALATYWVSQTEWEPALAATLLRRACQRAAAVWLSHADPDTWRHARAECELVERGAVEECEMAERWIEAYRAEARAERPGLGYPFDDDAAVRLAAESATTDDDRAPRAFGGRPAPLGCWAQARVVEHALELRADADARRVLAAAMPRIRAATYQAPDAALRLEVAIREAATRAYRTVIAATTQAPRFRDRVLTAATILAFEWYVAERSVADGLVRAAAGIEPEPSMAQKSPAGQDETPTTGG